MCVNWSCDERLYHGLSSPHCWRQHHGGGFGRCHCRRRQHCWRQHHGGGFGRCHCRRRQHCWQQHHGWERRSRLAAANHGGCSGGLSQGACRTRQHESGLCGGRYDGDARGAPGYDEKRAKERSAGHRCAWRYSLAGRRRGSEGGTARADCTNERAAQHYGGTNTQGSYRCERNPVRSRGVVGPQGSGTRGAADDTRGRCSDVPPGSAAQ